ncbi:hypothetical protein Csa_001459, partial [Cucumis sativus]
MGKQQRKRRMDKEHQWRRNELGLLSIRNGDFGSEDLERETGGGSEGIKGRREILIDLDVDFGGESVEK